jgi:stage II sporulation protein D
MAADRSTLLLAGNSMSAWNPAGGLVASGDGVVRVSAAGDRIVWGGSQIVDSPLDVWARGGLLLEGKRLPGRVRLSARGGRVAVVAVVPLEEYVAAVLSQEASPTFLPEALSALSVAVRTYAIQAASAPRDPDYDLVAGVEDQVFEGVDSIDSRFRAASGATRGEILLYGGRRARTVYHSTCGGRTESAAAAWGTGVAYLPSRPCEDCRDSPVWRWEYRMGLAEGRRIALSLGIRAGDDLRIEISGRTPSGRASRVRLVSGGVSRELKAALFRQAAGYARVRSLWMEVEKAGDGFRFTGRGYGHGVGMCQWGANGMARRGAGYRDILARYYPGTRIASGSGGSGRPADRAGGGP